MSNLKKKLVEFFKSTHGIILSNDQLEEVNRIVLEGNEGRIFESEMEKVRKTRRECADAAKKCLLEAGPFPNDETRAEAVENAILKSKTPNLTNSVRYMVTY